MDYHILALLSWPGHANISQDLAKYHNSYPLNLDEHDGTLLKDCIFHRFSIGFYLSTFPNSRPCGAPKGSRLSRRFPAKRKGSCGMMDLGLPWQSDAQNTSNPHSEFFETPWNTCWNWTWNLIICFFKEGEIEQCQHGIWAWPCVQQQSQSLLQFSNTYLGVGEHYTIIVMGCRTLYTPKSTLSRDLGERNSIFRDTQMNNTACLLGILAEISTSFQM